MTIDLLALAIEYQRLMGISDGDDWEETSHDDLQRFAQLGQEMAKLIMKVAHRDK